MRARLIIGVALLTTLVAGPLPRSHAQSTKTGGETAVVGMIHHVSGTILTLKDARIVGTTQPPPGLGTDGLLELTMDKKSKGVTAELKAGDTVRVAYRPDGRKRLRVLTVAPAPR